MKRIGGVMVWPGLMLLLLFGFSSLVGCGKALFPEDAPRTQYDRFLALRGKDRPEKRTAATGPEEPNLGGRLKPLQ